MKTNLRISYLHRFGIKLNPSHPTLSLSDWLLFVANCLVRIGCLEKWIFGAGGGVIVFEIVRYSVSLD